MSKSIARDIVMGIVLKYSNPEHDETRCRMSELVHDFTKVIEKFERERNRVEEHHEAWLRMQRNLFALKPSIFGRMFGKP